MDITRGSGDGADWRFVDEEGLQALRQAELLLADLEPPYSSPKEARAAIALRRLTALVRELHDRVAMAESYVETATKAVADELKVPCLDFSPEPVLTSEFLQSLAPPEETVIKKGGSGRSA